MPLVEIRDYIQDASQAMATILETEVTVIDNQGMRIAGTGCFKSRIGEKIPQEWLLGQLLKEEEPSYHENSGHWTRCRDCAQKINCSGTSLVASPITLNQQIIGLICLVGFYDDQKARLRESQEEAINYLVYMAGLIATKISEGQTLRKLEESTVHLSTVLDNLSEGVVAVSKDGVVTGFNRGAERITGVLRKMAIGKQIDTFFGISWENMLKRSSYYNDRSVDLRVNQRTLTCFVTVNPIQHSGPNAFGGIMIMRGSKEVHRLVQDITMENPINFNQIIGESESFQRVKRQSLRVAKNMSTILLLGESGTGKEMFCRSIHAESPVADGPFVAVNCAAIPETLLESELFGYEDGAFSGSKKGGKPGKFELANGGTLLLDEIGDMPLFLQAKILRVLETKAIERIGGIVSHQLTSVRMIFATNKDLWAMVKSGQFREDLYYRISVVPIHLPPLRERHSDIPLLMAHYLHKFCTEMHSSTIDFSQEVKDMFRRYPWPGNIRELRNVIEYAVNMEVEDVIGRDSLPQSFLDLYEQDGRLLQSGGAAKRELKQAERDVILEVLQYYGNTTEGKRQAAKALGISLASLYRKLKVVEERKV